MPSRPNDYLLLGASAVLCTAAAVAGGIVTAASVQSWYQTLQKPSWNPPDGLFGPVWTVLYLLMAVALWRVWRLGWEERGVRPAVTLFLVQLGLNVLWSFLFFGLRRPGWAFVEIVVLWGAILATLIAFYRLEKFAGVLLVPYLAWVTFAGILNGVIWRLNP
jgi:benzodiazapine receptor